MNRQLLAMIGRSFRERLATLARLSVWSHAEIRQLPSMQPARLVRLGIAPQRSNKLPQAFLSW
jgi:hypothetical protein